MPLVPRDFPPSTYVYKKGGREGQAAKKRTEHIMLAGGREGPEVVDDKLRSAKGKKPLTRTARYLPDGSPAWTANLAAGRTPEDTRTQSPFLRGTRLMALAYKQGLMTVTDVLGVADTALAYAKEHPGYVPRVEYTGVTPQGTLASASARLIDPDVDVLSQKYSANWAADLSQLAADLREAEVVTPFRPVGVDSDIKSYDFIARVYLNLKSKVSIPVEQFEVRPRTDRKGFEVSGVYLPVGEDPAVFMGRPGAREELQKGASVRFDSTAVEFVTLDPPKYSNKEFINSPAFARSRGMLLDPESLGDKWSSGVPGQQYIVPYNQILRLRVIYPPAADYSRKASRSVETTDSIEKDLAAARVYLTRLTSALVLQLRSTTGLRESNDSKRAVKSLAYTDPITGFVFTLEDTSFLGTVNPVLVWADVPGKDGTFRAPAGEPGLLLRPVAPIDFLRALRSTAPKDGMRKLRKK
jgi:hypothetical protein